MRLGLEAFTKAHHIARELTWRLFSRDSNTQSLTYPVSSDITAQCSVLWPEKLEWAPGEAFVQHIRAGLQHFVKVENAPIPQPYKGLALFHLVRNGKIYPVVLDYSDYMDRIEADARRAAAVYMKMQYRIGGYDTVPGLPDIQPGGYTVPNKHAYSYLPPVRRYGELHLPKHDVYGRYSLQFATGIRKTAVTLLSDQRVFGYYGGAGLVRYSQHLVDTASSKVCVDLPGNGPFCFRLLDYFAVGACIVAVRHAAQFPVPLVPGVHIAYVKDDLSDLVDVCRYYVENDNARAEMQRNSRDYFDRYLHRQQLGAYYLNCCLKTIV